MPKNKSTKTKKAKTEETGLIDQKSIKALGLDVDAEVNAMTQGLETIPPRVRIEHSSSGRHKMFIDIGESFDAEAENQIDLPKNKITGIICHAQSIKALWAEGENVPRCAAVENCPTVAEPVSDDCKMCSEGRIGGGRCKAKIRLLLLTWIEKKPTLLVFNLSPTSIKHFHSYVAKLARSKAPYISVVTSFTLQDTKKNSFRWAEVKMDVEKIVSQEELNTALSIREQFKTHLADVSETDFQDEGDKQPF